MRNNEQPTQPSQQPSARQPQSQPCSLETFRELAQKVQVPTLPPSLFSSSSSLKKRDRDSMDTTGDPPSTEDVIGRIEKLAKKSATKRIYKLLAGGEKRSLGEITNTAITRVSTLGTDKVAAVSELTRELEELKIRPPTSKEIQDCIDSINAAKQKLKNSLDHVEELNRQLLEYPEAQGNEQVHRVHRLVIEFIEDRRKAGEVFPDIIMALRNVLKKRAQQSRGAQLFQSDDQPPPPDGGGPSAPSFRL